VSKKLFKVCLILLISIQFIFSSPVFAESENLVKNPGLKKEMMRVYIFGRPTVGKKLKELQNFLLMNPYTIPEAKVRA